MNIKERLNHILKRIEEEALDCNRSPDNIQLVAVSKKHTADHVWSAIESGTTILGENYVQEAREKIKEIENFHINKPDIQRPSWHFIGHLQRNKAKYAVRLFDLIHSVDNIELAKALDKCAHKHNKCQHILIQISTGETSKSGVLPDHLEKLLKSAMSLTNIAVCGLMVMPPFSENPEDSRLYFQQLAKLLQQIKAISRNQTRHPLNHLSMGMTADYPVAIQEGATLIRVGTAIFGPRDGCNIHMK
jgi:hypothetical protein